MLEKRMRVICNSVCAMHEAECEFIYTHEFSPTVDHPRETAYAIDAAVRVFGEKNEDSTETCSYSNLLQYGRFEYGCTL